MAKEPNSDIFQIELSPLGEWSKICRYREGRVTINGRPWVHAVMCDNSYSDICTCMIYMLQPCKISEPIPASYHRTPHH